MNEYGDWVALVDQVMATVSDVARILRAYYDALREEGFSTGEALILCESFSRTLVTTGDDD